jgi:hypothetical protein
MDHFIVHSLSHPKFSEQAIRETPEENTLAYFVRAESNVEAINVLQL